MTAIMRVLFGAVFVLGLLSVQTAPAQAGACYYPSGVDYVLPQNCEKACTVHGHHDAAYCRARIGSCEGCWKSFKACVAERHPCGLCTQRYAACMRPLDF